MTKDEWYADRIMWRAGQHGLFEKRCATFESLGEPQKKAIGGGGKLTGVPVLAFYESSTRWTVLTTREVVSFFGGQVHFAPLDLIKKQIKVVHPPGSSSAADVKQTANRLWLPNANVEIWAPEGQELLALMNILQMFPLSVPLAVKSKAEKS